MTKPTRIARLWAAVLLGLGAMTVATACAPDTAAQQQPEQEQQQQQAEPDGGNDGGDQGAPDGQVDPAQATRIDGVAVSADGPSVGNLFISLDDDGSWCKGATLFWNPSVDDGVVFTIENVTGAQLQVERDGCGDLKACIGTQLPASDQVQCSMKLRASDSFEEVTPLELTGTVTCKTAEACESVRTHEASNQERLYMCSPAWSEEHNCLPESG